MKKLFVSILAIAGLAACSNESVVREQDLSQTITFDGIFVENSTRSNDPSTTSNNINEFYVWAIMDDATGTVFTDETVKKVDGVWGYDNTQVWAPNHKYYFSALAGNRDNIEIDFAYNTGRDKDGLGTVTFTNVDGTNDLLYAEQYCETPEEITTAPEAVKFQFDHLLSKVKFTFINGFTNPNNTVVITGVTIDAPKTATIDLCEDIYAWDDHSSEVVTLAMGDVDNGNRIAMGGKKSSDNERLTIPADSYEYTVKFRVQTLMGEVPSTVSDKEITLSGVELLPGRAYNFVATINEENAADNPMYEIVFDVEEVNDWITSETPDSQVEEAELRAALQLGGEVKLTRDITVNEPLVVPAGVSATIDLNNYYIVNNTKTDEYGKGEGIVVYGDLTIKGEGYVSGTTRAVWARGTEGATVTINGGTYYGCETGFAEGGCSVIYASSGNVINIYGGTFQALAADKTSYANKTEGVYAALNVADNNGMINVYGGEFYKQNPAAPGTEPAAWNAAHPNGFVAEGYFATKVGDYYVVADAQVVATAEDFAAAMKSDAETIAVKLNSDLDVAISSLGQQTGGSGEYKLGGENTKAITIDLNGKTLNITTTYWSNLGAKNNDALFTIKNGTMTSSQPTGTWNSYDLTFSNCNYAIEDVTFEKAIAFANEGKSVSLKDVTINETHDYYAMWITAEGQNVTIDGLTVNSANGRGIKIDEQYVDALAKVTLNIANSTFKTAKKAAIIVKSAAGADITVSNVNIANVAEDTTNVVWVDEDAAAYFDLVTVNGATKKQE